MKQIFLIIAIIGFSFTYSQTNSDFSEEKKIFKFNPWDNINGIKVAPSYFENFEFEISYFISSYPESDPGFGGFFLFVQNIGLGLEYINSGNHNAIGGKLTYELNYSLLSAQIGTDYIISNKDYQYRLMPKIGLSLFSFLNLYFGWNFNLRTESTLQPPKYNLTLSLNLYDMFW